jgi:hypothetical protein
MASAPGRVNPAAPTKGAPPVLGQKERADRVSMAWRVNAERGGRPYHCHSRPSSLGAVWNLCLDAAGLASPAAPTSSVTRAAARRGRTVRAPRHYCRQAGVGCRETGAGTTRTRSSQTRWRSPNRDRSTDGRSSQAAGTSRLMQSCCHYRPSASAAPLLARYRPTSRLRMVTSATAVPPATIANIAIAPAQYTRPASGVP